MFKMMIKVYYTVLPVCAIAQTMILMMIALELRRIRKRRMRNE